MDIRKQRSAGSRLCRLLLGAAAFSFSSLALAGANPGTGIVGSPHDLSGFVTLGAPNGQICLVCHTPHNAITADAPLWNHQITTKDFTGLLYTSDTMNATPELPDGVTKMCLSCHDGTVGIDAFGDTSPTQFMSTSPAIGADGLQNDHPVSFVYTGASDNDDGIAKPDVVVTVGSGAKSKTGTLAAVLLDQNGKLQCNSCHDVHNNYTVSPRLLKISINGSALCLTCHTK